VRVIEVTTPTYVKITSGAPPGRGRGGPRDVYVKKRAMVVAVIAVIAALCIDYLFRPFPTFLGSSPCTT
jgi:hypothetical protein